MKQNITGSNIRKCRESRRLTQEEMIAKLQSSGFDISRSTYAKIESHIRQVRDIELKHIANVLKIDINELFD